jgi:hypothetical protein
MKAPSLKIQILRYLHTMIYKPLYGFAIFNSTVSLKQNIPAIPGQKNFSFSQTVAELAFDFF